MATLLRQNCEPESGMRGERVVDLKAISSDNDILK